ncbi:MAG: metal-dependent phosphohydrolase [Geminicoccaceae bacterium]
MLYPTLMLADALADRLVSGYREMFGCHQAERADFVATTARLAMQLIGDSDALYHDAQHTALVTLVGQDILRGRMLHRNLDPDDWTHLTLAMLLHDIGYVRGVCPGDRPGHCVVDEAGTTVAIPRGASDAWLAPYHIERGKITVRARLSRYANLDVERIARAIERTRFPVPEDADHAGTDDEAGLVRAADLVGQLADPLYLRRAGALFCELNETGVAAKLGYQTPADLVEKYPAFYWNRIEPYIGPALRCLRRTMAGKDWIAHLYANVFTVEHQLRTMGPEPISRRPTPG